MAAKHFGTTWWGNAWLKALTHIDYSNRLPRGMRYARNGSVKSIDIASNRIDARVQGRRRSPYRITITVPAFSDAQKRKVKGIMTRNPLYASQLAARKLPETILADVNRANIPLFPNSWRDLDMHCSCPDWAVPCKHLAAVIYIVANEIDKNPFLVFLLHDYDLLADLSNAIDRMDESAAYSDVPTLKDVARGKGGGALAVSMPPQHLPADQRNAGHEHVEAEEGFFERAARIDFANIPSLAQDILSIMSDNPLFAPEGNFKSALQQMYRANTAAAKRTLKAKSGDAWEQLRNYRIDAAAFSADLGTVDIRLKALKKGTKDKPDLSTLDAWIAFVTSTDFSQLRQYPETWTVLWLCFSFALRLLHEGAYIPQVLRVEEKRYVLRWIPALFHAEVAERFHAIAALVPDKLVKVKIGKRNMSVPRTEAALLLIAAFLRDFIRQAAPRTVFARNTAVANFFFRDQTFTVTRFEDTEIPATIHLWLSRFEIANRDLTPVIKIDEDPRQNRFLFDILVDVHADTADTLINLRDMLTEARYATARMQTLKDLGVLSEYLPAVNDFLAANAANPVAIPSDAFVNVWFESLPILKILGIRTMIPKALRNVLTPQLALAAGASGSAKRVKTYLDLAAMLRFQWQVAVGDTMVDPDEFFKTVKRLSGIVKMKDQYVLIDQKAIAKLLKDAQQAVPDVSPIDMLRMSLEEQYKGKPLALTENLRALLDALFDAKPVPPPAGLEATLRPYQERGWQWLRHHAKTGFGAILADDMGLGKTVQVITLLLKHKEDAKPKHPSLVIVPTTLLTNWEHECRKFAPALNVAVYHGPERELTTDCDVLLTTYAIARNDRATLKKTTWEFMILDEAQNIKNHGAGQTKAIKSLPAAGRIAMTGTPVENSLMEYWSIMDFLNKGLLGTQASFRKDFAVPIEKHRDQACLDRFLKVTAPFILRRVKSDKSIIADLPDKISIDEYCALTAEQAAIYQNIVEQTMEAIEGSEGIQRKGLVLKLILALKQVCNHPVNYLDSGKRDLTRSGKGALLQSLVEKVVANREKCLIFTQYKTMGNLLQETLSKEFGTDALFLHGGTTRKKRDAMVASFQDDHNVNLFILSLKAGGTGLNLTAANHVVHYDLWWNPAVEVQATDRAYRIGQQKNVNVYRLITEGTFEEKINDLLTSKQELFDLSVQQGENWITEMSNADLKNLVALQAA